LYKKVPEARVATILYLIFLCLIFLADFTTKAFIQNLVQRDPQSLPLVVFDNFFGIKMQIGYAINSGAAWGVFSDYPGLLVSFRILLISVIAVYLLFYNKQASWTLPLVCILAGALGNVTDYFLYGYVIDMIQINFWGYDYPVFNIADSAIFIGAVWLLLLAFFNDQKL